MIVIIIIAILILISFLLNEYYYWIVCDYHQYNHMKRGAKGGPYDVIAFGSAYCRYGLDFKDTNVYGYNFGYGSQFFYYTNLMLHQYARTCKKGGVVYIIIADLVFAKLGKGLYGANEYIKFLDKRFLKEEYSVKKFVRSRFPVIFNPSLIYRCIKRMLGLDAVDDFTTLENNKLSEEKVKEAADLRCESWCRQFGLRNTVDSDISDELAQTFVQTRQVLTDMIQFCLDNQLKPLLVVTPVSKIMNERISDAFMERVLFSNIKKANVQNIPVLNYLRDNEFEDYRLYHNNADCLNARGRCLFTKKLLTDTQSVI